MPINQRLYSKSVYRKLSESHNIKVSSHKSLQKPYKAESVHIVIPTSLFNSALCAGMLLELDP